MYDCRAIGALWLYLVNNRGALDYKVKGLLRRDYMWVSEKIEHMPWGPWGRGWVIAETRPKLDPHL